jgi:hypothetical protein
MTENVLLVEGETEKRVLPELMERAGVLWGPKGQEYVRINALNGVENFDADSLLLLLKSRDVRRVGLVVDADEDPKARWKKVRSAARLLFDLPDELPEQGTIALPTEACRRQFRSVIHFGVWVMPDNSSRGMLETFLTHLLPTTSELLWKHALQATSAAASIPCPQRFIENHFDKASIHTWLAWQNPPGLQLHQALYRKLLDPRCSYAEPFVRWFCQVFDRPRD